MNSYIFDLETDGLLDTVTTVHSLVLQNINDGTIISCCDDEGYTPIDTGISFLNSADLLIGHNVIKYDIPVLEKLYPKFFKLKKNCLVFQQDFLKNKLQNYLTKQQSIKLSGH